MPTVDLAARLRELADLIEGKTSPPTAHYSADEAQQRGGSHVD
jgi:hypothetical protein